ncbi:hypothetical protein [Vagococcus carniphilus]|uniref:hypothetical protein n=1 Tax=Vagococcus carniphilus TaxID=218144 RepID=UPI00288EB567|nr:hypothetical protein [Vagococcus carniphilus]MDT2864655.1 hypothetical protein [Vagococcus carniphilus]
MGYKVEDGLDELIKYLNDYKLNAREDMRRADEHGFTRTVIFEVYGYTYTIIWFCNLSTIILGDYKKDIENDIRLPQFSFTQINFECCHPIYSNGNSNLEFFDETEKAFYGRKPVSPLRIPIEK